MSDYLYGVNPVSEALRNGQRQPLELLLGAGEPNNRQAELVACAEELKLPVRYLERRELDRLVGRVRHQGVALKIAAFAYADFSTQLDLWRASGERGFFLLLDGITDPHNFGAILRSAEIAGCVAAVVAKDRSCPVTSVVEKTAAGALSYLPLCRVTNLARAIEELKVAGVWCYGLAGDVGSVNLFDTDLSGHVALVVGSEGDGLRPNIRRHCDQLLAIPMHGRIDSLNASVAAGIALFETVRQQGAGKNAHVD